MPLKWQGDTDHLGDVPLKDQDMVVIPDFTIKEQEMLVITEFVIEGPGNASQTGSRVCDYRTKDSGISGVGH